jgi:NADPH:quinone reductase-like Zn-dependent oxidoreductase
LVRIDATTVNRGDCGHRMGKPYISRVIGRALGFEGLLRPKQRILGGELAGEIEAVGAKVAEFSVGDRVFGTNLYGANAEFACMRERGALAHMPDGMTFEQAAAVPDCAILALGCLRAGGLREGQRILVYGASGSIGTAGVQLAKHFWREVTAVCNTKNVELVRSLGAHEVIDYTREDFTKNGQTYDVIFDAVGKHSFTGCRGSLNAGGVYLPTDGFLNLLLMLWTWRIGTKRVERRYPLITDRRT